MKNMYISVFSLLIALSASAGTYTPDWESLKSTSRMPEWLQDAKFGYYFHWGVQTFANEDTTFNAGFYPGRMYEPDRPVFAYHQETFGDQATFGWKDVIKAWEPKAFSAQEWADLFVEGGAKYGGCLAMHVDNVALWDSDMTEWNLMNYGPKTDVLGDIQKAYRAHNMPMVATFHHGVNWTLAFLNAHAYDAADGKNLDLYNEPHKETDPPTERFLDKWQALVDEVVTKYSPEGLYFDYGLKQVVDEPHRKSLMANYYNHCVEHGVDGAFIHKHRDIIPGGVLDVERGRPPHLWNEPFMNDKSIARRCWFNKKWVIETDGLYTTGELLCALVDLVSKKGVMMLSVAPDKQGRIPENQQKIIREIGAWLKVNGEGIYGTRACDVIGEGPFFALHPEGWHRPFWDADYTAEDLRYTRSKDGSVLYLHIMARPEAGIISPATVRFEKGANPGVRILGHGPVLTKINGDGAMAITIPELDPDKFAAKHPVVLAIETAKYHLVEKAAEEAVKTEAPIKYVITGNNILAAQLVKKPAGKEVVLLDYFLTPSEKAKISCGSKAVKWELNDKGQAVIPVSELGKWTSETTLHLTGFKVEKHYDHQ